MTASYIAGARINAPERRFNLTMLTHFTPLAADLAEMVAAA